MNQPFQNLASTNPQLETCHFAIITQAAEKCFPSFFPFELRSLRYKNMESNVPVEGNRATCRLQM